MTSISHHTDPAQGAGNGRLFADVHEVLRELRALDSTRSAASVAAHLAALDEQLVADAPDPQIVAAHLQAIEAELQTRGHAAELALRLHALREEFADRR